MSQKEDIKAKLDAAGIDYDPTQTIAQLQALLAAPVSGTAASKDEDETPAGKPAASKASADEDGFIVKDPLELRPVMLPLVITIPESASLAQKAYAKILNSYAYQNPEKWKKKKNALIQKLRDLKDAPDPVESNLRIGGSNKMGA